MTDHSRAAAHESGTGPLSALDAIFTRRSVRAFTPQKIDRATVQALLEAAVQAPTAMHTEPWAFVVVQDEATLKRLSDRARASWAQEAARYRDLHPESAAAGAATLPERLEKSDFNIFYNATTLIVICARTPGPFVDADCWLAAQNLMLAACALGLATCCVGSAIPALNSPQTKVELGMAPGVDAVVPIIVGVPSGPAAAVPRLEPHILSWT